MNKSFFHQFKLLFLFFMALLTVTVACNDGNKSKADSKTPNRKKIDLTLNGEELFSKHCKLCHGIKGNLQLNGAKDLALSTLSIEERIALIKNGKGAMTPFKKVLSKEEIARVAKYSKTFSKK